MDDELKQEIKSYLEASLPKELEKYFKIYSSEELLTKSEFLEALKTIQQRFEAVDRHFEAVDRRFEAVDRRFEELIGAMNKKFEMQNTVIQEGLWNLKNLTLSISRIETKEGILLEKTVIDLMKDTLKLEKIDPGKIRKEFMSDPEGKVFFPGYTTDIDVLLENDNTYLIEIKSTASSQDIAHFLQNAKLFEKITGKKPTHLILVTLRITQATYSLAEAQKIRTIAGEIF